MLTITWRPEARRSVSAIVHAIAESDPAAAQRIRTLIETSVLPLAEHPYLFRPGRIPGTRELVAHPNYIVVYRVMSDRIQISDVIHARRQYPPLP